MKRHIAYVTGKQKIHLLIEKRKIPSKMENIIHKVLTSIKNVNEVMITKSNVLHLK